MHYHGKLTITNFGTGYVNCLDGTSILIPKENINYAINGDDVDVVVDVENKISVKGLIGNIVSTPSFIGKNYLAIVHHFHKGNIYVYVEEIGKKNLVCIHYKNKVNIGDYLYINICNISENVINGQVLNYIGKFGNECFEKKYNLTELYDDIIANPTLGNPLLVNRIDLSSHNVFTIDPKGSKDLDDAFSITRDNTNNNIHIFVHIADVSEYIYPETTNFNFKNIMKRGNTIYGINRNWTMLPRLLADDLCSLLPGKLRPAITNEFIFSGDLLQHVGFFYSTVLSKKQYTYEDLDLDIDVIQPDIHTLYEASLIINNMLQMIPMNEQSNKISSHKIVELFMLLTNKVMGEFLHSKNLGNFRFHPPPYINQLRLLKQFFSDDLYENPSRNEIYQKCIDNKELLKNPIYNYIIKDIMRKAMYVPHDHTHNHYALGIEHYIHFTSPIRRASDLINHLMIRGHAFTDDYSEYFNDAEYIQVNVENMIMKHDIIYNLLSLVGKVIECYIINVKKTGITIYIHNYEHDIHISKLSDKRLMYDAGAHTMYDVMNNNLPTLVNDIHSYKLFDKINVMLESVDIIKNEIVVKV